MFIYVHDNYMALMNDNALETGENVYKIASERSERADFFVYICVENIRFFSNLNIYIVDKSLFVGTICPWLGS